MTAPELDPASVALLSLAAPPIWTDSIARALPAGVSFPVEDLRAYVDDAVDCGVAERRRTLDAGGSTELRFWVTPLERRRILERLQSELGAQEVIDASSTLARSVLDLGPEAADLPPALRDWASLTAAAETDGNPSVQLLDRVRAEVEGGHLARAQEWCAVGEALTPLFQGSMEVALARSNRVIERGYRQRADEALLGRYLRRPSIDDAVLRMLNGRDASWLHLHGPGGVGKSMLVRDLGAGRFAEHHYRDEPLVVARVDFDLLDPEFPVRQPAELLLALADDLGLAAATNPDADAELSRFHPAAITAHEALSAMRGRNVSLDETLEHPAVGDAIDRFADTIAAFGSRVLLVLDTCEELAKAYPGYEVSPAVEATYRILDRVRSRAPDVRVLFCGRRTLPPHDGLVAHQLRGFEADEARRFLRAAAPVELDDELVAAILEQSPAVEEPDRYNPFDLDMYLTWIVDAARTGEEPVDANVVRSGGRDAYVERRIVQRLRTSHQRIDWHLLDALPAISALGAVTRESLAAVTGDELVDEVFAELAKQEWVGRDHTATGTLAVKSGMLRRLRSYYGAPARTEAVVRAMDGLADRLAGTLGDRGRAHLPETASVVGALRISEPHTAAELWERLVDRVERDDEWASWMLKTAAEVDGASAEERWPSRPALRASVTAAMCAALRRTQRSFDPSGSWSLVSDTAGDHPVPERRAELAARAALGHHELPTDDAPVNARVIAAAVDAVDRSTEAGDDERALAIMDGPHFAAARAGAGGEALRLWAENLLLRMSEASHPPREWVDLDRSVPPAPAYPDWLPPAELAGRIALEQAVWARSAGVPLDQVPLDDWERHVSDRLDQIDGDRLASACLRLRLAWRPLTADELAGVRDLPYVPGMHATCRVHEIVPPLFATVAEGLLGVGEAEAAMRLVDSFRESAVGGRRLEVDAGTQLAADVAAVSIARQLRDPSSPAVRRSATPDAPEPVRHAAIRALVVLGGPERRPTVDLDAAGATPESWHAWWQTTSFPIERVPRPTWDTGTSSAYGDALRVSVEEMQAAGSVVERDMLALSLASITPMSDRAELTRASDPLVHSRVVARQWCLQPAVPDDREPPMPGPRRAVAQALAEEAELAAAKGLRSAPPLYRIAAGAFRETGDWQSEVLARASNDGDPELPDAVERLRRASPDHPLLTPAHSGPWSFWSSAVAARLAGEPTPVTAVTQAPVLDTGSPAAPRRLGRTILTYAGAIALVIAVWVFLGWLVHLAMGALFGEAPILVTVGVTIAVLAFLGFSLKLAEVSRGRGIGLVSLRVLGFATSVHDGDDPASPGVHTSTTLRAYRSTGLLRWPMLLWCRAAARLFGMFGITSGGVRAVADLSADPPVVALDDPPHADAKWWSTAETAPGLIVLQRGFTAQPWERLLDEALDVAPPSPIAWVRVVLQPIASGDEPSARGAGALLVASGAWSHHYAGYSTNLPDGARPRLVHLVGNLVDTMSGPRFERTEEGPYPAQSSSEDVSYLAGADVARRWKRPDLVVVQPPPVDVIRSRPSARDLATRSSFAQELLDAGAAAVVVLPEIVEKGVPALADALHAAISRRVLLGVPALQRLAGDVRAVVREYAAADSLADVVVMVDSNRLRAKDLTTQGATK